MTPHTLALEACRLLVESYMPERGAYALSELAEARETARRALEAVDKTSASLDALDALDALEDPTTLNIGGGR